VISGEVAADVGTGHGRLPVALVERGTCPRVIATEVAAGPGEEAARLLAGEGRIELRRGWGLAPLKPGEARVLVLAGMGGPTIAGVLERGAAVAGAARRLVLQPQNRPAEVRRWLLTHGFVLEAEELVEEGGHFYPILAAAPAGDAGGKVDGAGPEETPPGTGTNRYAGGLLPVAEASTLNAALEGFGRAWGVAAVPGGFLLEVGPLLAAGRHPVLVRQLEKRLAGAKGLEARLAARDGRQAQIRARAVADEIVWLEMMCGWLRQSAR
jgi:hypothetical protein